MRASLYPNPARYVCAWTLTLALVFAAVVVTSVGCVPVVAIQSCEKQQAIFQGITKKEDLSDEGHDIATAAHDGFATLLYNMTGTLLPEETVVRLRDRGLLPEDYPQ